MLNKGTGRFYEMDMARAVPLLFLPIVHCYEDYSMWNMFSPETLSLGRIWLYLCVLGPSIFMTVLGMNITFSSHTSPKELLARGIKTLFIFFGLNFVRGVIPMILGCVVEPSNWPRAPELMLRSFLASDILMFAALSFLFFALMKKLKLDPVVIYAISLVLMAIGMLIHPVINSDFFKLFLGHIIYVDENSCFPFLFWIPYPALGYILGGILKSCPTEEDRKRFYNRLILVGFATVAVTCACLRSYGMDVLTLGAAVVNGYSADFLNYLIDAGIGLVWIGMFYYIWNAIRSVRAREIIVSISKAIMIFYIFQWLFVCYTECVLVLLFENKECLGNGFLVICSLLIALASLAIAVPVQKKIERKKQARRNAASA